MFSTLVENSLQFLSNLKLLLSEKSFILEESKTCWDIVKDGHVGLERMLYQALVKDISRNHG